MKISRSVLFAATGLVLVGGGTSRAAAWQDDVLNVQLLQPNPETVAYNGNFTVPASNIPIAGTALLPLSIGANTVTFENKTNAVFAFQEPSLVKITDTTASPILNVQVDPASTITLARSLVSGGNFLQFDLQQLNIVPSGSLILDVTFKPDVGSSAPVPEPTSLALLGGGIAGLLGFSSRRTRKLSL